MARVKKSISLKSELVKELEQEAVALGDSLSRHIEKILLKRGDKA